MRRARASSSSGAGPYAPRRPRLPWSPSRADAGRRRASGELLPHDPAVVEGEVELREVAAREPSSLGGVVAAPRFAPDRDRVVENGDRVPARIPLRIGVDPADAADANLDARLLPDLPRARLLRRFAHFAESTRKSPPSSVRRPSATNEKNPAASVPGPRVDRQLRTFGRAPPGHGRTP